MKSDERLINDWFINLILDKWKLHPVGLWLLVSAGTLTLLAILAAALGEFSSHGNVIGFVDSYGNFANFTIGTPAMIVFYVLLSRYLTECFNNLIENKVFDCAKPGCTEKYGENYDIQNFFTQLRTSIHLKRWYLISFGLSAAFMFFAVPAQLGSQDWTMQHLLSIITIELLWFFLFLLALVSGGLSKTWDRLQSNIPRL